ncbi:MAG: chemotaxis protein CheW [Acidobacteria bacterium]|nr:chemotaxis protein CheW [Acidobacteriota bacterium]
MIAMIDAEDILTLPSETPWELLPDLLPDLSPENAAPVENLLQFTPADFGEDDVLSLADELPDLQPLPPLQQAQFQEPLRHTEPLQPENLLANFTNLDESNVAYHGESTALPARAYADPFVLEPLERHEPSALAAELAARLAAVELPSETVVEAEKHVVFALAGAKYAVPMEQVLEVCDLEQFTPVINVPDWVLGIANLRGDIVSVVDLRHFLDSSTEALARRQPLRNLVVVQTQRGDLTTCLAVESMLGLAQAPTAEIQTVERVFGDGLTPHTRGFLAQGDELLSMLNLESLLRALEITG